MTSEPNKTYIIRIYYSNPLLLQINNGFNLVEVQIIKNLKILRKASTRNKYLQKDVKGE